MIKRKISIPKRIKNQIDKYPMVSVEWYDIVSNSSWSTFEEIKKAKLATCIPKGHLFSQSKGIIRLFGDYSFADNGVDIENVGNTTIIPLSVVKEIKKLS